VLGSITFYTTTPTITVDTLKHSAIMYNYS